MDKDTAYGLASRINAEHGWNAEVDQNTWTGAWHVNAWQDEMVDAETGERDGYTFHFPIQWLRVRESLAEEAASGHA